MSIKYLNLDEDVYSNETFQTELIRFQEFLFSGTNDPVPNYRFYNHYFENSQSGSWYLDIFDKRYDAPTANKLLSISFGYTTGSSKFTGSGFQPTYQKQKLTMYRLFAKRLLGSEDSVFKIGNKKIDNACFIAVSRNQYKDRIDPASTSQLAYFSYGSPGSQAAASLRVAVFSNGEVSDGYSGPYSKSITTDFTGEEVESSVLLYQNAGVLILDADQINSPISASMWSGTFDYDVLAKGVSGTTYNDLLWGIKHRINSLIFNSTQKIASSYIRCTAQPDEFNYSSNPTFVDSSNAIITAFSSSTPTVYFTQIGLMNRNGEVLAVAKLKNPIKKHPDVGVRITVRLDY